MNTATSAALAVVAVIGLVLFGLAITDTTPFDNAASEEPTEAALCPEAEEFVDDFDQEALEAFCEAIAGETTDDGDDEPTPTTEPAPADPDDDGNGGGACGESTQIAFTPLEQETGTFVLKIAEHIEPNSGDTHVLFDGDEPPEQGDVNVFRLWGDFVEEHEFLQGTWWSLNCPSDEAAEAEAMTAAEHAASVTPNPQIVYGLDGSVIFETEGAGGSTADFPSASEAASSWGGGPWTACPGEASCLTFEGDVVTINVPAEFCVEGWDGSADIPAQQGYSGPAAGATVRASC